MIHLSSFPTTFAETAIYLPRKITNELTTKGELYNDHRAIGLVAGELRGRRRGSIVEIVELGDLIGEARWSDWTAPQGRRALGSKLEGRREGRLDLVGAWLVQASMNTELLLPKVFPDRSSLIIVRGILVRGMLAQGNTAQGNGLTSWRRESGAWFEEVVTPGT